MHGSSFNRKSCSAAPELLVIKPIKLMLLTSTCVTTGSVRTRHSGEWHVKGEVIRESTDSTWKKLEAPLGFES